jgi:phosphoglycolate phosphatase-like HAD superfamily hydrolase
MPVHDEVASSPRAIACVVLDFDGTLTDVAREAPPFDEAFPRLLADLLGRDIAGAWAEEERRVRDLAPELPWVVAGQAAGPADADPYARATSTAQLLLDRFQVLTADPGLRSDVLTLVFRRAYRETRAAFRPEARRVLEALLARGLAVHVVTNAPTEVAAAKLATLAPAGLDRLRIHGDAGKFLIGPSSHPDERFARLPVEKRVPGLQRPVLLQRGSYFDRLASIWAETGTSAETTLVCGDIFELDLAMPAEMGAQVHLVRREKTYAYEVDAVTALGVRGGVSEGLTALLERVDLPAAARAPQG